MRLLIPSSLALASALLFAPSALCAQAVVQALPGTTNADRLADTMRRLAVSPNDLGALLDAGELSLKVDDLSGAASLFARADKVDPRSARAKAGMAAILVRAERPGEALRYFQQAESFGISPERIAADRGLAYDLVGEQERAQRDYRTALRYGSDDEVLRRYALSLGISGRRDQAIAVLDPLIRRSDRGAWRARAFILAMTGDVPGASTIATTMMPSGMAQGLLPFFARLPGLPAVDRAFAVHFGEVRATPERLADARLTPVFAPLAPEPQQRPVAVASAMPAPVQDNRRGRNRRDRQRQPAPVQVAAASPTVPVAVYSRPATPAVVAPSQTAPAQTPSYVQRAPAPTYAARPSELPRTVYPQPGAVASTATVQPLPGSMSPMMPRSVPSNATVQPLPGSASSAPRAIASVAAPTSAPGPVVTRSSSPTPGFASLASAAPVSVPVPVSGTTATPAPAALAAAQPAPSAAAETSTVVSTAQPAVAVASTTPPPVTRPAQDSVLARIIANLAVPGAELGVTGPARAVREPEAGVAEARAKAAQDTAVRRAAVARLSNPEPGRSASSKRRGTELAESATDEPLSGRGSGRRGSRAAARASEDAEDTPTTGRTRATRGRQVETADDDAPATRRGKAARRNEVDIADKDAGSTRRGKTVRGKDVDLADEDAPVSRRGKTARGKDIEADDKPTGKKALADKKDSATRRGERAEPERIWVQVATGANEGDLPKAWERVQAKARDALKNRAGYTTPLRSTNRVATGPFKTKEEAQAFVNALAKKGVSASTFTSDAGQKVAKLPAGK